MADALKPTSPAVPFKGIRNPSPDGTALIKTLFSIKHFVALGLLGAAFLPRRVSLIASAALVLPSLWGLLGKSLGWVENKVMKEVKVGRTTARIEGDFVVFLIGAKWNGPMVLNNLYKQVGDAFMSMVGELKADPEKWGYLGSEQFFGVDPHGPHSLTIIYWRSFDHLVNYARTREAKHYSGWKFLMEAGRKHPEMGFWHETYMVKAGQYENIYANMAPMGLGNCLQTSLIPAKGAMASARGRVGQTKGEDFPEEQGKPDY